jgi:flagellar protein FlaI
LLDRLARVVRGERSALGPRPYEPKEHGPLATFETDPGIEECDRYWVHFPYALVVITADPATNALTYRVVEPALDPVERELLAVLENDVRDPLLYRSADATDDAEPETLLRRELDRRLAEYDVAVSPRRFESLFYYLYRTFQGYGRIDPLMSDPHIEDVSCDGYDLPLFVYHDTHGNVETTVSFGKSELDDAVVRLAQRSGQHVSLGRPVVEATLPDGSRAELALGTEVTPRGSAFTIRRYAEDPFTPLDLIATGTFSTEQIAYLWLCIEHDRNLLFAGGTASGKTTAMNAVSMFVPPRAKVLSTEDTRELTLYHDNWLSSVTRERFGSESDITMYELLRSALRHRPEYIIVGEVRGKEAMTLFQAMNTGHTTYSTMHADSVRTVINRLENEPIGVPRQMVRSLDVLCVQGFGNVEGERVRRNEELAEIEDIDERTGELDYSTAFEWRAADDNPRRSGQCGHGVHPRGTGLVADQPPPGTGPSPDLPGGSRRARRRGLPALYGRGDVLLRRS